MPYKVIYTSDSRSFRKEFRSRGQALMYAESGSAPINLFGLASDEEKCIEVTDGKGIRIFDAAIPKGSRFSLAWRDSKRTWIRGYPTEEEAEEGKKGVPKDCEAVVLKASQRLPWSAGTGFSKPIYDREKFEEEIRKNGGFIVGEDEGPLSGTSRETS